MRTSTLSFGHRLRQLRERAGKTPEELADLAGIHPGVVRKLENGQSKFPRLDTAAKLATALGVTTNELA